MPWWLKPKPDISTKPTPVPTIKSSISMAKNSSISMAKNSSSPMNRQGAANMMQANSSNSNNSNNSFESFSQYDKTSSTSTNVSRAVHQLETKTDKVIEQLTSANRMQRKVAKDLDASDRVMQNPMLSAQGASPQGVGQELGVSEGPGKGAFDRFFNNQTFSIPEWRQRMG